MGKFKAAVFDCAGTTVDFGSCALGGAKAFSLLGTTASMDRPRPDGRPKWDPVQAMSQNAKIAASAVADHVIQAGTDLPP